MSFRANVGFTPPYHLVSMQPHMSYENETGDSEDLRLQVVSMSARRSDTVSHPRRSTPYNLLKIHILLITVTNVPSLCFEPIFGICLVGG